MNTDTIYKIKKIPLTKPYFTGNEITDILACLNEENSVLTGHHFIESCQKNLQQLIGSNKIYLTNSCTAGLEMAGILTQLEPGDEVIMPSFTFPSTANAFVLRGAIPTFVDIRADTLNIDETLISDAIST